jgi:DHA1 family multidrug/chloramphenicol efflux transport protein-like MFS transporter
LFGVAFFMLSCLATYLVHSIEGFIALRVVQGMGLCFINAAMPPCKRRLKKPPRSR